MSNTANRKHRHGRMLWAKALATLLTLALLATMLPAGAVFADDEDDELVEAEPLTIEPIEDQEARIVVASESGGVNWGCEPLVLTVRTNPVGVDLSVSFAKPNVLEGSFSGLNGNILTLAPCGIVANTLVTVTASIGDVTASTTFRVTVNKFEDTGEYEWGDLEIPGGGAICGYVFHPYEPNILYAHTDVGGAWKFNFEIKRWEDITKWCSPSTQSVGQTRGLAIDPTPGHESWIYIINNQGGNGVVYRSKDFGESWVRLGATGTNAGGNSGNTRGIGGNFYVKPSPLPGKEGSKDPADYGTPTIWFATTNGFSKSVDEGMTWTRVDSPGGGAPNPFNNGNRLGTTGNNQTAFCFVAYDPNNLNFMVVGSQGTTNAARRDGVFYSKDGGATWAVIPDQPQPRGTTNTTGYHGCKAAFTAPHNEAGDRYMYVTYNDPNANAQGVNDGYAGDGCVFRWVVDKDGNILSYENITPVSVIDTYVKAVAATGTQARQSGVGYCGISIDPQIPGCLVVASHGSDYGNGVYNRLLYHRNTDTLFRSLDYGNTWFPIQCGFLQYGDMANGEYAPYSGPAAKPCNVSNMDPWTQVGTEFWWEPWTYSHWNYGPQINPFNSDNMFTNSGIGVYTTWNLTALDKINAAEPHSMPTMDEPINGDSRVGLFTTTNGVINRNRQTSVYTPYRMFNSINNLTAAQSVKWECAPGLEMTVMKTGTLYSPPAGKNIAISAIWDYGGFAFTSLLNTELPERAFSYTRYIPEEWRYMYDGNERSPTNYFISGDSIDYVDGNPDIILSTGRTEWHFHSAGGLFLSVDEGYSFNNLPDGYIPPAGYEQDPPGYQVYGRGDGMPTAALQTAVNRQKTTMDVTAGHIAIGADAKTIVWGTNAANPAIASTVYSKAEVPTLFGQHWEPIQVFNTAGGTVTGNMRVMSDRVDPEVFYGFGTGIFVSRDGGVTYRQATVVSTDGFTFPNVTSIDREIRGEVGNPYNMYVSANGLYKLRYDKETNTMYTTRIVSATASGDAFAMTNAANGRGGPGLGVGGVLNGALYAYGRKPAVKGNQQTGWGVYRSLDGGETWTKISISTDNPEPTGTEDDPYLNANFQFADVRGLCGDPRVFGRAYLTEGNVSGAVRYGNMIVNLVEDGSGLDADVNKAALVAAIAAGEAVEDLDLYSIGTVAALEDAIAWGKLVLADERATQPETDAVTAAIHAAIEGLKIKPTYEDIANLDYLIDCSGAIATTVFDDVEAFLAAFENAKAVRADLSSGTDDYQAAYGELTEAAAGLRASIKASFSAYTELIGLLVFDVAQVDASQYTADSVANLFAVAEESWAFILYHAGLSGIDLMSEEEDVDEAIDEDADADAEEIEYDAFATVDDLILAQTIKLREALSALMYGPGSGGDAPVEPPVGNAMTAGIAAAAAVYHLDVEYPTSPAGAKYVVSGADLNDLSYVHLRFSFPADTFNCTYALSDYLAANGFEIDSASTEVIGDEQKVSLFLRHRNQGGTAAGGDVELLYIYLTPLAVPFNNYASIGLEHLDVSYEADGAPIDADVTINPMGGTAWVYYYSVYDIDRNGVIALADVDYVRRAMGIDNTMPEWEDIMVRRRDVNHDGKIDILDLIAVIAAYEYNLS